MKNGDRVREVFVSTGCYQDLDVPVIATSGEVLLMYFGNAEKMAQDGGEFKRKRKDGTKIGDSAEEMYHHAIKMAQEHPDFAEVIDIMAEHAQGILDGYPSDNPLAISGGQTRDWFFSAPVAAQLGQTHLSIYKDGRIDIILPDGTVAQNIRNLRDVRSLHIVDMLTKGSSCYRTEDGVEKGWVPYQTQQGAMVTDLMAVFTRLQGAEERLAGLEPKVNVHTAFAFDAEFLREYSNDPEAALEYLGDDPIQGPIEWTKAYLRENSPLFLVKFFDPNGKDERGMDFLYEQGDYRPVLEEAGKFDELADAVQQAYGRDIR